MAESFSLKIGDQEAKDARMEAHDADVLWLPEGNLDRTGAKSFRLMMKDYRASSKPFSSTGASALEVMDLSGVACLTSCGIKSLLWWCDRAWKEGHRTKICCGDRYQYAFFAMLDWPKSTTVCLGREKKVLTMGKKS